MGDPRFPGEEELHHVLPPSPSSTIIYRWSRHHNLYFLSEFSCPSLAWSFSFPFSISSHMERAPRMLHVPRQPRCAVRGGSFLDLDHGCHARDGLASRVALLRLPDAPCTALASSSWNVFLARLVAGGFGCSVVCLCDEYTRLTQTHRPSTRRAGVDRTPARRRARCGRRR